MGAPSTGRLLWSLEKRKAYKTWINLRYRCRSVEKYKHVSFCKEWNDFEQFLIDMGLPKSNQSIDRIDGNKDYSKENCRWASIETQNRNRSVTVLSEKIVFHARRLYSIGISGRKLAKIFDVNYGTLRDALCYRTWRKA
jgi:hypothetical protein